MESIKFYIFKLVTLLKSSLFAVGTLLSAFFAPINGLVLTAIMLCLMDFIIKIMTVYKKEGWKAIESSKMRDTFTKIILYSLAIICVHFIDEMFIKNIDTSLLSPVLSNDTHEFVTKIKMASGVSFLIVIRELKSIDENWIQGFGWGFFSTIKEYVLSTIKFTTKLTKDEKNN